MSLIDFLYQVVVKEDGKSEPSSARAFARMNWIGVVRRFNIESSVTSTLDRTIDRGTLAVCQVSSLRRS
jgi:hypothetical protein